MAQSGTLIHPRQSGLCFPATWPAVILNIKPPPFNPVSVNPAFKEEALKQCGGGFVTFLWKGDGRFLCVRFVR